MIRASGVRDGVRRGHHLTHGAIVRGVADFLYLTVEEHAVETPGPTTIETKAREHGTAELAYPSLPTLIIRREFPDEGAHML